MLANNPSVLTGGGVATNVVNGTFQLIGPTGSIALTAQGTNQNITLTPSGTGTLFLAASLGGAATALTINNASTFATAGRGSEIVFTGTSNGLIASIQGMTDAAADNTGKLVLRTSTAGTMTNAVIIDSTQTMLLGTATNSSNGRIQLATHTTSAGGIGIGTDWSLYRETADYLNISTSTGGATALQFFRGANKYGRLYFDTVEAFVEPNVSIPFSIRISGQYALTCDTSKNTTFFGIVIHKSYTVATLPAAAAGNTYGTTFVSDATNAAGTGIGTAPTGGGAVKRAVYSTGAAWLLL